MRGFIEFIFPQRLHRLAFFLREVLAEFAGCALGVASDNEIHLWAIAIVLTGYQMLFIILPRLRDIEMGGWWLLLCPIPVLNVPLGLILLLRAPVYLHPHGNSETSRGPASPCELAPAR